METPTGDLLPVLALTAWSAAMYWLLVRAQPEYRREERETKAAAVRYPRKPAGKNSMSQPRGSEQLYFKSSNKVLVMRASVGSG